METATIVVKDVLGSNNAILHSMGHKLYNALDEQFTHNSKVIVDFKGINNLTTGFCNSSFGQLFRNNSIERYSLIIRGLDNTIMKNKVEDSIELGTSSSSAQKQNDALLSLFE